jgi:cyclase
MQRRNFIQRSAIAFGALSFASRDFLSAWFQDPFKITMLTKQVGIFTEKGGTIAFYLGKDGIVAVDSQFPEQSEHLIAELKKRSATPFKLLINTHHHGDHTSGNIAFKGVADHVLAHANSLKNQKASAIARKNEDKQLYPDRTYTDVWRESISGESFALHYFGAGHTDGDSLVHFEKADIVHMGDLLFNRVHPYVDRSAGANIQNWGVVLDKAVKTFPKKTRYVYGHAAEGYDVTGTAEDLKAFREYLAQITKFVEAEIKSGKTREEVLKTTTLPFATTWKGDGLDRPLGAAYDELSAK